MLDVPFGNLFTTEFRVQVVPRRTTNDGGTSSRNSGDVVVVLRCFAGIKFSEPTMFAKQILDGTLASYRQTFRVMATLMNGMLEAPPGPINLKAAKAQVHLSRRSPLLPNPNPMCTITGTL